MKKSLTVLFIFLTFFSCKKDDVALAPTLSTTTTTEITETTATSGGNATDDGGSSVTAKGVCWSTNTNPTTANNTTNDGTGTGSFTSSLTDLTENTTYYVRAYATNSEGTAYGNEIEFTTEKNVDPPTLTTTTIIEITVTTAKSGGDITDNGGSSVTARGICWSTNPNPTIANNTTNDGTGTGSFTSSLTGLTESTTYYVRAYATNSEGTAYGNEEEFTSGTFPGETVTVTGGTFLMGSTIIHNQEKPIHSVTLNSFSISKYEITNQQYADYMNSIEVKNDGSVGGVAYLDLDSSYCQISYNGTSFLVDVGKANYPVIEVSWFGAKAYSEYYGGRLPTEAEWEFASRGGNSSNGYTYSGSNTIDEIAWYGDNSGGGTHTVGKKNANEIGLYDMTGNVWEWCNDWFSSSYYGSSPSNNPQGPSSGYYRVFRGGSRYSFRDECRVAYRGHHGPQPSDYNLGFRPVFVP